MSSDDTPTDTPTPGDRHLDDANAEQSITEDAPTGGDDTTEEQLDADNDVEEDMLKTLDPGDAPA